PWMAAHHELMPSMSSRPSASRSRTPSAETTGSGGVLAGNPPYGCQTCSASAARRAAVAASWAARPRSCAAGFEWSAGEVGESTTTRSAGAGAVAMSGVRGLARAGAAGADRHLLLQRGGLGVVGRVRAGSHLQDLEAGL